jgi:light-regulated signal transduction histidine kinase (bacteriophytochrome)
MSPPAPAADPAFGRADLGNCEREPIHLAGAVQPHGVLLVLTEPDLTVVTASRNCADVFGRGPEALRGHALASVRGELAAAVQRLAAAVPLDRPHPVRDGLGADDRSDAALHRVGRWLVLEIVPPAAPQAPPRAELPAPALAAALAAAVQRLSAAPSISALSNAVVQVLRELTGFDRVMVYRFDPDGHGKVVAEAREPRLEPLLGHHYPASDIPQVARRLYLQCRMRLLPDAHAEPAPLVPALLPGGEPLDMSQCQLRAMSPMHLQYLRNMGVTASFSASLVRDGQLWGLVAGHHLSPRRLSFPLFKAVEILAEVASTRIAAIENYAHAQVALMVRRLEQRLVEATSTEGDWRVAIFRNPRMLLQPLEATGAVLFHDDQMLTAGEVPSSPELRALLEWVQTHAGDEPLACSALAKANPGLAMLTPTASGVLAVRLSTRRPDYLIWLRKEQLLTVTWAGDPNKPMAGDDPLTLSPRRSFAAWSEIVRGTAAPWSVSDLALARAVGASLVDIILQVQAVRLLIAEHQLSQIRASVADSREPVLVCDAQGRALFSNAALHALAGHAPVPGQPAADLFSSPPVLQRALDMLRSAPQPWQRELELPGPPPLPVSVRAEVVAARDGKPLGFIVVLADLRERRRTVAAREHLEAALREAAIGTLRDGDDVVAAILTNASLAAMDIAEARGGPPVAPLLEEVEASTRRAAELYAQLRDAGG